MAHLSWLILTRFFFFFFFFVFFFFVCLFFVVLFLFFLFFVVVFCFSFVLFCFVCCCFLGDFWVFFFFCVCFFFFFFFFFFCFFGFFLFCFAFWVPEKFFRYSRKQILMEIFSTLMCFLMSTLSIPVLYRRSKNIPKLSPFTFWPGAMVKCQWLEIPVSRTNFHGPKDVRAIEVRLYMLECRW